MRDELTADNLAEFKKRFGTLHDSVIHYVRYDLFGVVGKPRKALPRIFTITLGAIDFNLDPNQAVREDNKNVVKWVNLTIEIENVSQVVMKHDKQHQLTVIFGMQFNFFGDAVYVVSSPTQLNKPEDFADSASPVQFGVVGRRCFWSVQPYQTRGDDYGVASR